MRKGRVEICILASLAIWALARAGEQPTTQVPQDDSAFELIKLGTDVIQSHVSGSLAGCFVIVLRSNEFATLQNDADLGPFIASAVKHTNDAIVVVIPNKASDSTYAVFFTGRLPIARSTRPGGTAAAKSSKAIEKTRRSITTPVPEGADELYFQEGTLHADDGTPVLGRRILSAGPRRKAA